MSVRTSLVTVVSGQAHVFCAVLSHVCVCLTDNNDNDKLSYHLMNDFCPTPDFAYCITASPVLRLQLQMNRIGVRFIITNLVETN